MQLIDSIETYAYGTRKGLVSEKQPIKCKNIINDTKMINFDDVTEEKMKENNPNCSQIPDHPYGILTIGGSGSGKSKSSFNPIGYQPDID